MKLDYRDLALEHAAADYLELQARVADLEHDYALTRLMLSDALTIAATAKQDAAHERRQRFALAEEYRQLRVRLMTPPRVPLRSLATMARDRRTSAAMLALRPMTAATSCQPDRRSLQ